MNTSIYSIYLKLIQANLNNNYTRIKQLSNILHIYSLSIYLKAVTKDNRSLEEISNILQEEIDLDKVNTRIG